MPNMYDTNPKCKITMVYGSVLTGTDDHIVRVGGFRYGMRVWVEYRIGTDHAVTVWDRSPYASLNDTEAMRSRAMEYARTYYR